MQIELLPVLQIQRELYAMPRGMARFQAYLHTLTGGTDDLVTPLVSMNPMGKEHLSTLLDTLLSFDAEAVARAAIAEAHPRLLTVPATFRVALVVTDDAQGGWTNRYFNELQFNFEGGYLRNKGWIVVPIWSSETWTPAAVREAVLLALYRAAYIHRHGTPTTLAQMLHQEGFAARFAGSPPPALDPEELDYTRAVIEPHLSASGYPALIACLFGDDAAISVGYRPLGLSPRAGYALAHADALRSHLSPETALTTK